MKHTIIRVLAALAVLALPVQSMAAEGLTLAQQGPYPGSQQQQGQPQYGGPGQQPGQPPQGGSPGGQPGGYQQPRPPMEQPPVGIAPPQQPQPPQQRGYEGRGQSSNRQYKAVLRCNQRQASCAQNCNRRTYGRARNMCNNHCNADFVNCTTRATSRR